MYCWLRWFQHVCEQAAWCSASGHFQRKQREVALGCMLQSKVTAFQEWSWTFHDDLWITSEDFLWSTLRLRLSATLVSDHGGGGGLVAKSSPTLGDPMNCVAHQAPLSMGFSRRECQSEVTIPLLQGIFPSQEFNLDLLHSRRTLYQLSHQGKFSN